MTETPAQLETRLLEVIRPYGQLLTAFSAGIDSTLVAVAAQRALGRENAPAAIGDSPSLPRNELEHARQLAAELDLDLIVVEPDEQADESYQQNLGDRCFFCKTHLYDVLRDLAAERGFSHIANGTNRDDAGDHRPGLVAADNFQVVSPLAEAGFGKAEVRQLAAHWRLPNADKPAAACLASRIAYGLPVTTERLSMVEAAEDLLREHGFVGFRVRHHETGGEHNAIIARIEVPLDQLPRLVDPDVAGPITQRLNGIGYTYITADLAGFRSGSGNVLLKVTAGK